MMTEAAIVKGLKWLQTMQDPEGSWGGKDKDDKGEIQSQTDKNAMTGMALLCYLGHCELQDSPDFGPTVRKAIDFITSTTPEPENHSTRLLFPSNQNICTLRGIHNDQN